MLEHPRDTSDNIFEKRPKTTLAIFLLIIFILLEVQFRLLAHFGVFPYQHYETRNIWNARPAFLDDINRDFGVWHYADASGRHTSPCFDVTYHSNSWGMVDRDRTLRMTGDQRIVVLGDSYVEGFGVESDRRFTNILEKETGVEYLNFGSSGSFGPLQEWLLYRNLASRFEHTDIFLFFLPFNDFFDMDPQNFSHTRYRPYLRENESGYEIYYPVKFEDRELEWMPILKNLRNCLSNHSYLFNFLRLAARKIKERFEKPEEPSKVPYDDYSDQNLKMAFYCFDLIAQRAFPKRLFIFTIPTAQDLEARKEHGKGARIVRAMTAFASQHANIFYFDLAPAIEKDLTERGLAAKDMELSCDHHWNPLGHEIAAEAIKKVLSTPETVF